MAARRKVETVVKLFVKIPNSQRLELLQTIIGPKTDDKKELAWRADLCTKLELAGVYPKGSHEDPSD